MLSNSYNRPVQILLVEDNIGDIRLMQESLKETESPYNLHVTMDGVEATDFLYKLGKYENAPRPDIILLDINLPKKNGKEVLKEIKSNPTLKSIPVIVLSTSNAQLDVREAYELHANCCITKPINFLEFIRVMKSIELLWIGNTNPNLRQTPPIPDFVSRKFYTNTSAVPVSTKRLLFIHPDNNSVDYEENINNWKIEAETTAINYTQALEMQPTDLNRANIPDLIVLGISANTSQWLTVLKHIKTTQHLLRIPVLLLTSFELDAQAIDCAYALQANCMLLKSNEAQQIVDTMHTVQEFWFKLAQLPTVFR